MTYQPHPDEVEMLTNLCIGYAPASDPGPMVEHILAAVAPVIAARALHEAADVVDESAWTEVADISGWLREFAAKEWDN